MNRKKNKIKTHTHSYVLFLLIPSESMPLFSVLRWARLLVLGSWINWFKELSPKELFPHCISKGHDSAKNRAQNGYKVLSPKDISGGYIYGSQLHLGFLTIALRTES